MWRNMGQSYFFYNTENWSVLLTFIKTKENKVTLAGTWQGEDKYNYCSYV